MKNKPNFLISGANSYLAQSIRNRLSRQDCVFTSLARTQLRSAKKENEEFILCDLLDVESLQKKLACRHFDAIINCASIQPSGKNNFNDYYTGNVLTLKNLLCTTQLNPKTKFIHFSSAAVYGNNRFQKLNEETTALPANDYALSKLMSEHTLRIHALQLPFLAYCLRLPSLHGNHQKGGLINTYCESIRNNLPLEIYSKGNLKRSVMSFDEVATVCSQIITLNKAPGFYLYQLGSANALPTKEIAEFLIDKINSKSTVVCVDKAATNEADWDFDLTKACKEIDFQPTSIESSLENYITAEQVNDNLPV